MDQKNTDRKLLGSVRYGGSGGGSEELVSVSRDNVQVVEGGVMVRGRGGGGCGRVRTGGRQKRDRGGCVERGVMCGGGRGGGGL